MATPVPQYIEDRIRRPTPGDSHVVTGSTPVVAFGNERVARVATLGLNPSRVEFIDRDGKLLDGARRRLATLASLGVENLSSASHGTVSQVLEDCNGYFHRQPYRQWFDQFIPCLTACGASYYDDSACHLDLVQWATDPTWARLQPAKIRKRLISEDAAFLAAQLQNENIRVLLVNGNAVWTELERSMPLQHTCNDPYTIVGLSRQPVRVMRATLFDRVKVVGWSTNLQSSFGVTKTLREELPRRVATLIAP